MIKVIKKYKIFLILLVINTVILIVKPSIGLKSFQLTKDNALEMLSILPPVFILLGLLDVWIKRETMIKFMGEKSGIIGVLLAFLLGSAAAGPLYAAFPVAAVLLKKGSKFSNVLIMIGAWSTTKIPLLLFEASSMGIKFMITRFILNIFGIAIIAYTVERFLSKEEIDKIYKNAALME
ncbi:MAG: permease [Tissierellia bacterium]|nr:permease [Tissierellia bacterium]MDD3227534.1 permease [Tissierellia bacterium]MDD3751978.1 permease [Tissierellia bacterium]MDD4046790.1 permease [Tissierellia bacterium]MDD4679217.1 permease [Tissierellia bacterium]